MDTGFNWYAIKVVSGQEKKIKACLESEVAYLRNPECVKQILVTSERVYEMRGGKKRIKERSFLPGYVVLHANLTDPEVVHAFNQVPGVMGFLGDGAKAQRSPVPLRKQEVNRLLGKMDDVEENVDQLETLFSFGEQVKVVDGPFSNFTGSIEEINEEKHKLRVLVKIFGRSTPIELNFYQVEKLR